MRISHVLGMQQEIPLTNNSLEQEKWDKYYASLPLYEVDEATQAFNAQLVARISELLPIGSKILEAGCGVGCQSLALARSGNSRITLMGFSREALRYAGQFFELNIKPAR